MFVAKLRIAIFRANHEIVDPDKIAERVIDTATDRPTQRGVRVIAYPVERYPAMLPSEAARQIWQEAINCVARRATAQYQAQFVFDVPPPTVEPEISASIAIDRPADDQVPGQHIVVAADETEHRTARPEFSL